MSSDKEFFKNALAVLSCLATFGVLGATSSFASSAQSRSPASPPTGPVMGPQDDQLIFEIHLDGTIISDGLTAYQIHHQIFLPLGEIARILSLAITTHSTTGTAQGFFIDEQRSFSLDAQKKSLSISGKVTTLDPSKVLVKDDDIYVESHTLGEWFPIDFNVSWEGLSIDVKTHETLPIQARLAREKIWNTSKDADDDGASFKNVDTPYQWFDRPFVDQTLSSTVSGRPGQNNSPIQGYTTAAAGDLLGLQSNLYLSGTNQTPWDQHRLTMGRSDPDGNLLGPLRARSFSFGAVTLPGLNYVARPNSLGSGAYLSNKNLLKPTRFDTQSFSGVLLPGWDVELFHNGLPIRHQQTPENGRFRFDDVPLLFGSNDFRLIFHGPQGQIKEEHHRFLLEDSIVEPGEFYYSLGASRLSDGTIRSTAQFDKSILSNVSVTGGFTTVPVLDEKDRYFNVGVRSYVDSLFMSADAISASNGGKAWALGALTSIGSVSLSASQAFLSNFSSELFQKSDDPIVMESKLRLDTFLPIRYRLPVSLDLKRDITKSGTLEYDASGKVSTYIRGLSVSNTVQYQLIGPYSYLLNALELGRHFGYLGLRGSIVYNIQPTPGLSTVDLNADTPLGSQYTLTESVTSQYPDKIYRFTTGLNKAVGQFGFSASAGKSTSGEVFAGVRFNIALGVEPRQMAVLASAEPMTDTGAVSARVFVDKNLNGKYDEGEPTLAGTTFRVDGGQVEQKTNAQGIVLLHHLPSRQRVNVSIDSGSVDDPQLTPSLRGIRVLPRAGKVALVDFPLKPTTEIDGTLFRYDTGKKKPAADVQIELVDRKGSIVSTTKTSYDGFYILSAVPAGQYQLRVSPSQAERLKIDQAVLKEIRVLPNSSFISGIDAAVSLPPSERNLPDGMSPQRSIASLGSGHQRSKKGRFFFVVVGAFADVKNSEKVTQVLRSERLNFRSSEVVKEIPVYRVRVASGVSPEAVEKVRKVLQDYGYSTSVRNENEKSTVHAGPYYSRKLAQQERAFLAAAFSSSTLEESKQLTTLDLFSIGGFAWKDRAEEIQTRVMDTGLTDESVIREMEPL